MPRKKQLDTSWREPRQKKCEAPKELGKAPRCGKPFPAYGVQKTCSQECSEKLWLEWKRNNYKKNRGKILAQQKEYRDRLNPARPRTLSKECQNPDCPYGEAPGRPRTFVNRKGALGCSLHCQKVIKKLKDRQYYRHHPENWERSNAKVRERERAERTPTIRSCVVCGKQFEVKHPNTRAITCSLECRAARTRHMEQVQYAADIKTSRAKKRAKAKKYLAKHREKINARQRTRYHAKKRLKGTTPSATPPAA